MSDGKKLPPSKIYKLLNRNNSCSSKIQIIKEFDEYDYPDDINKNIIALLKNTSPLPLLSDLYRVAAFIPGGTRFGARYPDIIINKYDIYRARQILIKNNIHNEDVDFYDRVADLVFTKFNAQDLIFNDYREINRPPWSSLPVDGVESLPPFFNHYHQFIKKTFNCETRKNCIKTMKKKPNTLTNISALSYTMGDCREMAWLTALFCSAANNIKYRVCYTTLYSVIDEEKQLYELFDHVFVLKFDSAGISIVDPFAYRYQPNGIILHNMPVKIVKIGDYSINSIERKSIHKEMSSGSAIFLECGKLYVDGQQKHRLVAVPKIYNGSLKFIDDRQFNTEPEKNVLVWNKTMPWTYDKIWNKHNNWA